MVRPNPRFDTINPQLDEWVTEGGYERNLYLEKTLQEALSATHYDSEFKGGLNPIEWTKGELPSWWQIVDLSHDTPSGGIYANGYQQQNYTKQDALEFCTIVINMMNSLNAWDSYRCSYYTRDPVYCRTRNTGNFEQYANQLEKEINTNQAPTHSQLTSYPQYYENLGYLDEQENVITGLPQVFAEEQINLSDDIIQILNDIENGIILVPDWFKNNVDWVQTGHINEQEFLTAYNYLVDQQIAHAPTEQEVIAPSVNDSITTNMITQRLDNFSIVDGRAKGTITFTANDNFNPYYYGKTIINLIQFKTSTGANILPTIKTNNLRFTATERDETINYDEDMEGNTSATVESFVWEWIDKPLGAFSKVLRFNIDTNGKIQSGGIMGAGVAGAIGILILLGFITDSRRKK